MKKLIVVAMLMVLGIAAPAHAAYKAIPNTSSKALLEINQQVAATRAYLVTQRALMVAPTVNAAVLKAVIQHFSVVIPTLTTLAATPGLAAYAKDQLNNPNYDIAAEFSAMRKTMVAAMTGLIQMFPNNPSGLLLYELVSPAGIFTTITFTSAQAAPAVALIDAVIATIETE
jgi:hypothetical protein